MPVAAEAEQDHALLAGLPAVRGDAMLLTQVLRSLITNAMEAMDAKGRGGGAGGKLRVSVARVVGLSCLAAVSE